MKKRDEAVSSMAARSTELERSVFAAGTRPGGGGQGVTTTGGAGLARRRPGPSLVIRRMTALAILGALYVAASATTRVAIPGPVPTVVGPRPLPVSTASASSDGGGPLGESTLWAEYRIAYEREKEQAARERRQRSNPGGDVAASTPTPEASEDRVEGLREGFRALATSVEKFVGF